MAGSTLGRTRAITGYSSVKVAKENVRTWENVCDVTISEKKVTKQDIEWDPYVVTLAGKTPAARYYPCCREGDLHFFLESACIFQIFCNELGV